MHNLLSFHPVQAGETVSPPSWWDGVLNEKKSATVRRDNGTAARFGTWNAWAERKMWTIFAKLILRWKAVGILKVCVCPIFQKKNGRMTPNRKIPPSQETSRNKADSFKGIHPNTWNVYDPKLQPTPEITAKRWNQHVPYLHTFPCHSHESCQIFETT